MHRNNKYNHNHLRDNVAYNIFNLIFSLHYIKYWQWWNYHIQRSMRAFKISLYIHQIKKRNIHIIHAIESRFHSKIFSKSNNEILKIFKNDIMSSMTSFVEVYLIEFFTLKVSNIWKSSFSIKIFFFIIISFSFAVVTISKLINLFFFCLNSTSSFFFSFISFIIVLLSKLMTFLRFTLTLSRLIKISFRFIKTLSRFHFIFVKHLRK